MRDYFDWAKEAGCKDSDPRMFNRPKDHDYESMQARRICMFSCPVREQCLIHAIIYDEVGIWGGFDPRERFEMGSRNDTRNKLIRLSSQAGFFHPELMRAPFKAA